MPVRTRLLRLAFALLLPLLLGAQAAAQRPAASPQTPEDKLVAAMHGISSHTILDWVKEMVADKYEGRLTGTPSYDAVAEWSAGLLKGWAFKPAGDAGTYLQKFPNPYTLVEPGAELTAAHPGTRRRRDRQELRHRGRVLPGLDLRLAQRDGRGRLRGLRHHRAGTRLRRLQGPRREGQVRGLRTRGADGPGARRRALQEVARRTPSTTTR